MEQHVLERLERAHVDVQSLLGRCMNNEALMLRLLSKFPADQNHARLLEAMAARDTEAAIMASHTLKGLCGTLSLVVLHELCTRQVEALRAGDWAQAETLMPQITAGYTETVAVLQETLS